MSRSKKKNPSEGTLPLTFNDDHGPYVATRGEDGRLYTNKPTTLGLMILARDWDRLDSIGKERKKVVLDWMEDIDDALIFSEAVSNGMATNQEDTFIMGQFACMAAGASFVLAIDSHETKRVMLMQLYQGNQASLVEMEDASSPKGDPE